MVMQVTDKAADGSRQHNNRDDQTYQDQPSLLFREHPPIHPSRSIWLVSVFRAGVSLFIPQNSRFYADMSSILRNTPLIVVK